MTTENFIPQVWSAKLLENWNDKHVYVACLNRDYEGEVRDVGDTVKINSIGRITIAAYTKNTNHNAAEELDDSQTFIQITQADYYNFGIDSIDKAQQKPKLMSAAMEEASWGLADTADSWVADLLEAGVQTANQLTAATSVGTGASDDDAYEILVDLGTKLTENNAPKTGRWVVVPPWFHGVLLKDPRFVSFGTGANLDVLKNGSIGRAAGFEIKESNNVPVGSSSDYTIIAGVSAAATFADQIKEPQAYKPELRFGDAMKGLHVYGAKVTRPYGLASIVATAAA